MGSLLRGRGPRRVPEGSSPSRGRRRRGRFAGEKRRPSGPPRKAHSDPRRKPYSEPAEKKAPASGRTAVKGPASGRRAEKGAPPRDKVGNFGRDRDPREGRSSQGAG